MANPKQSDFRNHLLAMRTVIEHDSKTTAAERKPVVLDQSSVGRLSRMDALQVQAMQVETERRRQLECRRIDAALARLDNGEFGYCVVCGEEIEVKRLAHDPTAPSCITCARNGV